MNVERECIRVLVAEDNEDLSSAICELLQTEDGIDVVGTVTDATELLDAARRGGADVVVLDLNLAGGSSVPAMQLVRRERPDTGVVVYSGYDRADVASALPSLGGAEYVSKSGDVAELVTAVRRAAQRKAAGTGS